MELVKQKDATLENVVESVEKIKKFADEKGYSIIGDPAITQLAFDSKSQEKVCKNYLWRLDNKMSMAVANRFLHFIFRKVKKADKAPYVEYSEKELKIRAARKAWRASMIEAERLRMAYKTEKGNFYK